MPAAVGIDLGTTYSCIAVLQHGKVEVIANDFGHRTTPSCVAFVEGEEGEIVGDAALNQAGRNPTNTIYETKRLIGRDWNEKALLEDIETFPFEVINHENGPRIKLKLQDDSKTFSPQEIAAMILRKLKDFAEIYLGEPVTEAVITVPAYFTDSQKRATKEAGELAGLKVLRLIPEPSAAALAYGVDRTRGQQVDKTVLVYDLGGGTFDVSVALINGARVTVRATGGNSHLGGHDFDQRIVQHVLQEVSRRAGVDLTSDAKKMRRLLRMCERAKRDLSALAKAEIDLETLVGEELTVLLSRPRFEDLCKDLFSSTIETVQNVLNNAQMQPADIDEVILVGGSTRMPCVERMLRDLFPGKEVNRTINPDEAVAHGAALLAAHLCGEEADFLTGMVVQNVTPLSIGTAVNGGEFRVIIPRNTVLPTRREITAHTAFDNQNNIPCLVYQGERLVAARNKFIGEFIMSDLPPAPAGLQLDVALSLDEDGLLTVQAKVHSSEVWQGCSMSLSDNSSNEVVEHVVDAERFREEDQREVDRLKARLKMEKYLRECRAKAFSDPEKTLDFFRIADWFDQNKHAEIEEFRSKHGELMALMGQNGLSIPEVI